MLVADLSVLLVLVCCYCRLIVVQSGPNFWWIKWWFGSSVTPIIYINKCYWVKTQTAGLASCASRQLLGFHMSKMLKLEVTTIKLAFETDFLMGVFFPSWLSCVRVTYHCRLKWTHKLSEAVLEAELRIWVWSLTQRLNVQAIVWSNFQAWLFKVNEGFLKLTVWSLERISPKVQGVLGLQRSSFAAASTTPKFEYVW